MHKFRDLIVWKRSMALTKRIYSITNLFPQSEKWGLTSQLQRAAVSISANIAEGAGRQSEKDFAHFLAQANGSAYEVETLLEVALYAKYINEEDFQSLINELSEIEKMLYSMINHFNPA